MRKYVLALVLLVFIYGPIAVFFLVAAALFYRYETRPVGGCDLGPTGLPPLVDLGPGQTYQGFEGGLYPGASNVRPAAHTAAGQRIAQSIVPLDANGNYDAGGKIVFLPIGGSLTDVTWNGYSSPPGNPYYDNSIKGQALADPSTNPQLVFPDIILGGIAGDWRNPNDPIYSLVEGQLTAQGVTPQQVQIVWVYPFPYQGPGLPVDWSWPSSTVSYRDSWKATMRALKQVYPNVKIAYLGTRHHIYTTSLTRWRFALRGDPAAHDSAWSVKRAIHDSAWSVKWAIEDQINGDPSLNYDPAQGEVFAPWIAWGPYLWADDNIPRRYDEFLWTCPDVQDYSHPSARGVYKQAALFLNQMKSDPTATPWFVAGVPPPRPPAVRKGRNTLTRK
jgi:hypothetical protein